MPVSNFLLRNLRGVETFEKKEANERTEWRSGNHHLVVSAFGNILAFAIVKLDGACGIEV
jgi:hypothetical protein